MATKEKNIYKLIESRKTKTTRVKFYRAFSNLLHDRLDKCPFRKPDSKAVLHICTACGGDVYPFFTSWAPSEFNNLHSESWEKSLSFLKQGESSIIGMTTDGAYPIDHTTVRYHQVSMSILHRHVKYPN